MSAKNAHCIPNAADVSQSPKPATITVKQTTVENMIDQLAQAKLDEATLAALLFGDDHTAGKGFREMAARVRELLIVANAAADVCGPFAMLDYQGRELVPTRDMDRLRAALKPLIVKTDVAAETGGSHDH